MRCEMRCRSPPDSRCPRSPILVSYCCGMCMMKSWASAAREAATIRLRGCVDIPVRDVRADRVVEEEGVLRDDGDIPAQRTLAVVAHVDTVDQHGARCHVVKPRDQPDQGGLARSAAAHQRDHLVPLAP